MSEARAVYQLPLASGEYLTVGFPRKLSSEDAEYIVAILELVIKGVGRFVVAGEETVKKEGEGRP